MKTPLGEMWLADGVLWHRIDTTDSITEDQAMAVVGLVKDLTGGKMVPAVIDLRSVSYAGPEARNQFARSPEESLELATALLVGESASRAMASLFTTIDRPQRPVKVFTTPEEAEGWVRTFLDEDADTKAP